MISVIVPIYCVEAYLARCIESICNQSYTELEIILVDDGSPDSCGSICDCYAQMDSRISVIHKENGGLSDARNTGLARAHGEWICFIDSDDFIAENMLEILYQRCLTDQSDMAVCDLVYVDQYGKELSECNQDTVVDNEILTSEQALDKLCGYKYWYWVMVQNKLYRRDLFSDILFPKGKQHEDEFVMYRLYSKCRYVSCVRGGFYYYTQRNDSIMGRPYSVRRLDSVEAYLEQMVYFLEKGRKRRVFFAMDKVEYLLREGREKLDMSLTENQSRYRELEQQLIVLSHEMSVVLRVEYWLLHKKKQLFSGIKRFLK